MKTILSNISILMVFGLLLYSCKNNPTEPNLHIQTPTKYQNSTLPMFINNKWAYVDSNYNDHGSLIETFLDVQTISEYKIENNKDWWILNFDNGSTENIRIKNDSVYFQSKDIGLPNPQLEYLPSQSIKDTAKFNHILPYNNDTYYQVKVYRYKGKFETPAGSFDSVYVYESNQFSFRVLEYFKPQIGLLGTDRLSIYNNKLYEKSRLIYYKLIK
jgi:hypothetical protein